jgi:hypothetical protein
MISQAILSEDRLYRYVLRRIWAIGPRVLWLCLNPSTADETKDDMTIKRLIEFSRRLGFGGLTVVNMYAWRATDPSELWKVADPIGPENDAHLLREALQAKQVIAAWGLGARSERIAAVVQLLQSKGVPLHCLARTKEGHPKHPLARGRGFIPYDTVPSIFA